MKKIYVRSQPCKKDFLKIEGQFDDALNRIHDVSETSTQVELAESLGVRQSSISDAKRRRSVPAAWLLKLLLSHWVNPYWVLKGTGAKYLKPAQKISACQGLAYADITDQSIENFATEELVGELLRRSIIHMGAYKPQELAE